MRSKRPSNIAIIEKPQIGAAVRQLHRQAALWHRASCSLERVMPYTIAPLERQMSRSASAPQPQPISKTRYAAGKREQIARSDRVFEGLGPLKCLVGPRIERRRIIHAGVKPGPKNLIARVVVRGNVAAAAAPRICSQCAAKSDCAPSQRASSSVRGGGLKRLHCRCPSSSN